MAIIHHAELRPGKLELLVGWLPRQPWYQRGERSLERVAAFRFDDPEGEVGVETLLVRAGSGPLLQVPLSYRGAPLAGAGAHLIGTLEHSVLGTRWVYDGEGDPVYRSELARVILTGGTEVEQYYDTPNGPELKHDTTHVRGTGTAISLPDEANVELRIERVLDPESGVPDGVAALLGTWATQASPVLLATARLA